jgi:tetratricopeptide (TPR) repeat protein
MRRAALLGPLLALVAWPATATSAAAPTFDDLVRRGQEAHTANLLEQAIDLYGKALELKPDAAEVRFAYGAALYGLDRYPEARAAFRRVTAEKGDNGAPWAMKGMCEFKLGDLELALADIQKGRGLGLGDNVELQAVANYHAAILMIRFGLFEYGLEILREFALRERDNPGVIEAMGLSILRLPYLPSEAPVEKRELIQMAGRAQFQFARGRRSPTTRRAFEILVQRFPQEPSVRYAWGVFLLQDNPKEALAEFQRVLRMDPGHVPAMLQIAFQYIKEGRYEEARPLAEDAVLTAPRFFAARNALGRALLSLGEVDRAVEELEEGARLAPDSSQMQFHLTRAYRVAGRKEDEARARAAFMELEKRRKGGLISQPEGAGEDTNPLSPSAAPEE